MGVRTSGDLGSREETRHLPCSPHLLVGGLTGDNALSLQLGGVLGGKVAGLLVIVSTDLGRLIVEDLDTDLTNPCDHATGGRRQVCSQLGFPGRFDRIENQILSI